MLFILYSRENKVLASRFSAEATLSLSLCIETDIGFSIIWSTPSICMLPESNRIIGFSQLHSSLVPLYCAPPTRMHHTHTQCIEANLLCLTNPKRKETTSKCKSNTLSSNKRKQQCMEEEKIHSHSTNKHNLLALLHSPVIQICISSFFTFFFMCSLRLQYTQYNSICQPEQISKSFPFSTSYGVYFFRCCYILVAQSWRQMRAQCSASVTLRMFLSRQVNSVYCIWCSWNRNKTIEYTYIKCSGPRFECKWWSTQSNRL